MVLRVQLQGAGKQGNRVVQVTFIQGNTALIIEIYRVLLGECVQRSEHHKENQTKQ
jgi:hypothetical protein